MLLLLNGVLFASFVLTTTVVGQKSNCTWTIRHCGRDEIICENQERVYLDSKNINQKEVDCFAVKNPTEEDFKNYEIEAEMLSLESIEGVNSGTVGLIFNYENEMNYDFVYLE